MKDKEKGRDGIIDSLFVDPQDVRFWRDEGLRHNYLYWVRAMTSKEKEPPPFIPVKINLPESRDEFKQLALSRKITYQCFAQAFNEPDNDFLNSIIRGDFFYSLQEGLKPWTHYFFISEGFKLMKKIEIEDVDALREKLLMDYTYIFYDSYMPFIPPYESIYEGERQVMGESATAVNGYYCNAGLEVYGYEFPDHISNECEFIHILACKEVESWETGQDMDATGYHKIAVDFLRDHLLKWGGKFCSDVIAIAKSNFYLGIAKVGQAVFSAEQSYVELAGIQNSFLKNL